MSGPSSSLIASSTGSWLGDEAVERLLHALARRSSRSSGPGLMAVEGTAVAAAVGPARADTPRAHGRPHDHASMLATGERLFSFEFFPAKTDEGERQLWTGDPRARAAAPRLRLGDLRRRRLDPRPHGRDDRAHRHRHDADAAGPPHRRRPLRRRAAPDRRAARRRRRPQRAGAARRPAGRPAGRLGAAPEGLRVRRGAGPAGQGHAATSASAWRRSPRSTRARPTSTATSRTSSPSAAPAPTSPSRRCSSAPRTTCGCATGSRPPAATCRSSRASCR